MNAFIDTLPIRLTPLTPIHIGCGQEFEPTNYVIDDGVLYHFDPARVELDASDRTALHAAINRRWDEAILAIQRFFHARKDRFAGVAHGVVSVAPGVDQQYAARIGQVAQQEHGRRKVTNLLEIERTAHHPHSGQAYIPGSSIKGAIRTAWLDHLNQGRGNGTKDRAQDVEKRLLGSHGGFHADPFRLLGIADAAGEKLYSRVVFATNHKKREVFDQSGKLVTAKGPAVRRETIVGGQYRALHAEIRSHTLRGIDDERRTPGPRHRLPAFADLARACNRYYGARLSALLDILDQRRFAAPEWLTRFRALIGELQPRLDAGELMLLRVGRHSGAESVTLDGIRSIRIMAGKGMPAQFSSTGAKTVWLAADQENARSGMLPFGWLLIEPAAAAEDPSLREWCQQQPGLDLDAVRERLLETRRQLEAETLRKEQLAEEQAAQAQLEAERQAERERALAEMSPRARSIAEFVTACESRNGKDPFNPGSGLFGQAMQLSRQALTEGSDWNADERRQLADALTEWLPRVIDRLDRKNEWKDARKKLKLNALGGDSATA